MTLIPERFWVQMTEDEQRLVKETLLGLRDAGNRVLCPHCGKTLHVAVKSMVTCVDRIDEEVVEIAATQRYTTGEQRLLALAQESGMFAAFRQAVEAEKIGAVPTDIEGFFLSFLRLARPISSPLPPPFVAEWRGEFGRRTEFVQANGIIGVMSQGVLKAFVPNRLCRPPGGKSNGLKISIDRAWEGWRKSRFGYVPGDSVEFADAMKQMNLGKFCSPVQ